MGGKTKGFIKTKSLGWAEGEGKDGFSSLVKQNKKGKICAVFYFTGKRKIFFIYYAVIVKQKNYKRSTNHYYRWRATRHSRTPEFETPIERSIDGARQDGVHRITAHLFLERVTGGARPDITAHLSVRHQSWSKTNGAEHGSVTIPVFRWCRVLLLGTRQWAGPFLM